MLVRSIEAIYVVIQCTGYCVQLRPGLADKDRDAGEIWVSPSRGT